VDHVEDDEDEEQARRPARGRPCLLISNDCFQQSRPATRAEPASGCSSAISSRMVVVLPAPFGPRKPNTSASSTWNETSAMPRLPP
jgi:hypothetical protein